MISVGKKKNLNTTFLKKKKKKGEEAGEVGDSRRSKGF